MRIILNNYNNIKYSVLNPPVNVIIRPLQSFFLLSQSDLVNNYHWFCHFLHAFTELSRDSKVIIKNDTRINTLVNAY